MFKNCTIVDCPEILHTGAEMLLQLRVYILAEAFRHNHASTSSEESRSMFNEGQETADEQMLRERKASLLQLFKKIDLGPVRQSSLLRDSAPRGAKMSKEISIEGKHKVDLEDPCNEDEDDEEVLTEGQLDMIYKK